MCLLTVSIVSALFETLIFLGVILIATTTVSGVLIPMKCNYCLDSFCKENNTLSTPPPSFDFRWVAQYCTHKSQNISDGESQIEKVQFLLYLPYLILFYAFILFGIERMFKMMYEANLILYSYSSSNCANIFLSVLQCGIVVSDLQVDLKHLSIQGFLSFQEHSFSIIEHFVFDYCIILKMKKTIF